MRDFIRVISNRGGRKTSTLQETIHIQEEQAAGRTKKGGNVNLIRHGIEAAEGSLRVLTTKKKANKELTCF